MTRLPRQHRTKSPGVSGDLDERARLAVLVSTNTNGSDIGASVVSASWLELRARGQMDRDAFVPRPQSPRETAGVSGWGRPNGIHVRDHRASTTSSRAKAEPRELVARNHSDGPAYLAGFGLLRVLHPVIIQHFVGRGTVGAVAERLGRRWVGLDLNPAYHQLAKKRTAQRGLIFAGGAA